MSLLNVSTCMPKPAAALSVVFGFEHAYIEGNLFHTQFPNMARKSKELRYRKCLFLICESLASD